MGALKWGLKATLGNWQFAHSHLQLCTFVALLGPFLRGTFVVEWRQL